MADCSDIEAKLRIAEERLAAAKKIQRAVEGEAAVAAEPSASPVFRTFSMVDGTKIRVNPQEFYRQVEADNLAMGEEELRKLVQLRFDQDAKPNGSKGLNINYARMPLNDENVNALLTLAGQRRFESEAGQELAMPFTEEVAANALAQEISLRGGNVEEIARDMARAGGRIKRLPQEMALIKTMKLDSARYYADMLEDSADLIDSFGVSPQKKAELSRASQYMHFFEQLDALFARKIGQALNVRKLEFNLDLLPQNLGYEDIERLDVDLIKEGSLAAQVIDAIETGNAEDLRKLATAKRVGALNDVGINDGNVMVQAKMLNTLRKDNLFLSPNTWMQRNVVAGALMNFSNGVEDFYAQAFKTADLKTAFFTATFAYGRMAGGFQAAWANALESLTTGKATFTSAGLKEGIDPYSLVNRKENTTEMWKVAADGLNKAWDDVFNKGDYLGGVGAVPIVGINLLNLGARYVLGKAVEELTGSTAGFMPAFSLLAGGDEITRKMGFDWKVGFDAYAIALREWDELANKPANMTKAEWVAGRANQRADQAVFSGLMTDNELAEVRRSQGAMQYGDMSNETLRLKMFNDQNGLPNPGTPEGAAGMRRAQEVTFTQPLEGFVGQGIQIMRKDPVAGWLVPVWQTPFNGLKWLLDRDIFVRLPKQFMMETRQLKGDVSNKPFTPEEMADARAKTLNAAFISAATYGLWQTGMFTDGGSFNEDQRKRETNVQPYSFSIGLTGLKLGMSRLNFSGSSIDLVDLMGLQADIHRAHHEGLISDSNLYNFMNGVLQGYMRIFNNKQSLGGVVELINAMARSGTGQSVDWANVMGKQMSGVLPLSGLLTAGSRGLQDPNVEQAGRRQLSPTEVKALGKDPNWNFVQEVLAKIASNYPVLGTFGYQVRQRDWLGRERRRPFGVPLDVVAPFAPIITSDTPFDRWMNKHGLGSVPRQNGKVGGSDLGMTGAAATQMSIDEENTYRNAMGTIKGEIPAEAILGKSSTINTGLGSYSIDSYVQGRTMLEALTALSLDAQYNKDLEAPNSPSIANTNLLNAEQSLGNRTASLNDPRGVYKVWSAIVNYYDRQALRVMAQQHPDFVTKAIANSVERTRRVLEDLEASPLGLSRQ